MSKKPTVAYYVFALQLYSWYEYQARFTSRFMQCYTRKENQRILFQYAVVNISRFPHHQKSSVISVCLLPMIHIDMGFLHDGNLTIIIWENVIIKVLVLKFLHLSVFDTCHTLPLSSWLSAPPTLLLVGAEAAGYEIAGASEPRHNSLEDATAFLTVDKPVSRFYVFVLGKFHIRVALVNGCPNFCCNHYHMVFSSSTL